MSEVLYLMCQDCRFSSVLKTAGTSCAHPNSSPGSSSIKSKNGNTSQITYIWMTLVWLCDPQDTTIHLPSPCFCLPLTSFLQISDAAKSTARTLESIPREMLTQSCTECRQNGWLAQGKHRFTVLPHLHGAANL